MRKYFVLGASLLFLTTAACSSNTEPAKTEAVQQQAAAKPEDSKVSAPESTNEAEGVHLARVQISSYSEKGAQPQPQEVKVLATPNEVEKANNFMNGIDFGKQSVTLTADQLDRPYLFSFEFQDKDAKVVRVVQYLSVSHDQKFFTKKFMTAAPKYDKYTKAEKDKLLAEAGKDAWTPLDKDMTILIK
ncbi:hypothetical protein J2Z69_001842 [Paenibacillus shirakamiensis]|uniref:Lipoprotein n=2 Tax=Paenibacillus shirakamiensis TaxID=1265935 RepID=A0ABS4JGG1_9BACL|nr:hypothetical protein [Paenibacillus shirakamiensis]